MSGFPRRVARRLRSLLDRLPGAERAIDWWSGLPVLASIAFGLAVAAVAAFAKLADSVLEGSTQQADEAILVWASGLHTRGLDQVALEITALGNIGTLIVVSLAAAAVLWAGGRKVSVSLLVVSLLSAQIVTLALKRGFARPRPDLVPWGQDVVTLSFPSGHAVMSAVTYGTVAYLIGRMAGGGLRRATFAVAALLVAMVGLSRIYLGVHYPSDVLAGWLVGLGWTALLAGLFRVWEEVRGAPPEDPAAG